MYFKFSGRHNPHTSKSDWSYFEERKQTNEAATAIQWNIKPDVDINARSGVYFLRTTLETDSEELLCPCYNTIQKLMPHSVC